VVASDNPIDGLGDDLLHRAAAALAFEEHVLALDASEGLVVGVLGPWARAKRRSSISPALSSKPRGLKSWTSTLGCSAEPSS